MCNPTRHLMSGLMLSCTWMVETSITNQAPIIDNLQVSRFSKGGCTSHVHQNLLSEIGHRQLLHLKFYSKFNTMNKIIKIKHLAYFLSLYKGKNFICIFNLCILTKTLKLSVIGVSMLLESNPSYMCAELEKPLTAIFASKDGSQIPHLTI